MIALSQPSIDEIREILEYNGVKVAPRGAPTTEIRNVMVQYPIGTVPMRRGMNSKLPPVEAALWVAGRRDLSAIKRVVSVNLHLWEPWAFYGPLTRNQWPRLIWLLRQDPLTRRAVLILPRRRPETPPCTVSVQFLIRDGALHMQITMRSWDAVLGYPNDIAVFGIVGQVVARILEVDLGTLTIFASSLHVYNGFDSLFRSQKRPFRRVVLDPSLQWRSWEEVRQTCNEQLKKDLTWVRWEDVDENSRP